MPRGRPKKQPTEIEVLPPEDNQPPQKVIKHKTEWVEVVEEPTTDDAVDFSDDAEVEARPRRKTKNEREELRKKLAQSGATPGSQLKLTIERYLHSDVVDGSGGMFAETEHCTKYVCSESHVTGEDYIDVARRFGPGLYRFTLRLQNKIVTAWDKRISATPQTPVVQHVDSNDPTSPQVIVQGDGQQTVMPSIKDIMKVQREALKEQLEMAKLMREAYGFAPEQPQQQQTTDPKIAALQLIAENPDVMEKIGSGIAKTVLGSKGGDDSDPWAEVAKEAIRSGQASEIVASLIREIMAPFRNMWGNQNNGQAQMAQAPLQNQPTEQAAQVPLLQTQQQGVEGNQQNAPTGRGSTELPQGVQNQAQTITPAEQALAVVIANCAQKTPPQIVADQLLKHADLLNEQAPIYSIDGYLDMFAIMPVDDALEFVKTQPGGEQVASLPHAKEWTAELQRLIQEAGQEGEE